MITRAQMPRQLRNKGGITNAVPREKYGLGSSLKKFVRKVIPNEIADVAVKAAPFVAPFNPGIAGLMRGIGRFDQRGSLSDAFKQGLATTAFGAGARTLGGATDVMGGGLRGGFTSPLSPDRTAAVRQKAGNILDKRAPKTDPKVTDPKSLLPQVPKTGIKGAVENLLKDLPRGIRGQLIAGTATAGASLLASYFQGEFREQEEGESIEDYLAARRESVGKKMRTYMDNYFKTDPEYSKLDDAGRDAFVARYNLQSGGRIGLVEGGTGFMKWLKANYGLEVKDLDLDQYVKFSREFNNENPDPYETGRELNAMGSMPTGIMRTNKAGVIERDYRDEGGFVPVGIKEKADDVPAMLSKNEFVFTADAVRGAGNGNIEKGAQRMYNTMKNLEKRVV